MNESLEFVSGDTFKKMMDKQSIAKEQYDRFMAASTSHADYITEAKKYERFYMGDQWDAADLKALQEEGRPALTLNLVLSTVNTILGEQSSRRGDFHFKPKRNATKEGAHAMTVLAQAIADATDLEYKESEMFEDGIIQERGYLDIRCLFDGPEAEIKVESLHPFYVIPDPQANSYDPKDWGEVWITRWLSLDEIEAEYGSELPIKDGLKTLHSLGQTFKKESVRTDAVNSAETADVFGGVDGDSDMEELDGDDIKSVRVIERQFYVNETVYELSDPRTGQTRKLPVGTSKKKAEMAAQMMGVHLSKRTERVVRWRITADHFVLYDEVSPYRSFTVIPYFPYFRRGKPMGVIRNLLSPQEQYNKLASQELHIVNSTANGGWIAEKGALSDRNPIQKLAEIGSKTGITVEVNPGKLGSIQKIQPNALPHGITNIKHDSANNIRAISAISEGLIGLDNPEVSGVKLKAQEGRGQIQLQKPFDNLKRTRKMIARKMVELIQDFYTEERIVRYVDYSEVLPEEQLKEIVINQAMPEGFIMNDVVNGEFDITVSTMPSRDTINDQQFAELLNMRQAGVMVPDHEVIRRSNLLNKEQLADMVKQMQGLGEPDPMQQQIQMQQVMLQLQEMQMKIQKLGAETQLTMAKAQNESDEPLRHQETLATQVEMNKADHANRLDALTVQGIQRQIEQGNKASTDLMMKAIEVENQSNVAGANDNGHE